ncbi:hypothetical protein [Solibacillus isronensis]|uniref:hypothetical protein n=1 Tax=Solibacillus isronensis TaxID=412383 RepID=UPI0039A34794
MADQKFRKKAPLNQLENNVLTFDADKNRKLQEKNSRFQNSYGCSLIIIVLGLIQVPL